MTIFRGVLLGILFTALGLSSAWAADKLTLTPKVVLKQIKTVKATEKYGDDLYVDVETYPTDSPRSYHRIPKYPITWPSPITPKIKNKTLWSKPLKSGHSVVVLFSLMDQDESNFNPDDLIGMVRLELKNEKGRLQSTWTFPNQSDTPKTSPFHFKGKNGNYEVDLVVTNN